MAAALISDLEALVRETYLLWDPGWVTFNWRGYTYDHVQRVRGLSLTLCRREGGDLEVMELAALLHDITKPYDGEYVLDAQGQRLVDAHGYWRNELRRPPRSNQVTSLYDALGLAGQLHNESGAAIAEALLRQRSLPETLCSSVAETIRHHLRPPNDAPIESQCLYDADTIDANIGLPAFVRNIYIRLHYHDQRKALEAPSAQWLLRHAPLDYLRPYIAENLLPWVLGKRRDFVPRLQTAAAQSIALERLERLEGIVARLSEEVQDWRRDGQRTCVDVVYHYMLHANDSSLAAETAYLAQTWQGPDVTVEARQLIQQIWDEMAGIL
mgnify:CR=1 FL=1